MCAWIEVYATNEDGERLDDPKPVLWCGGPDDDPPDPDPRATCTCWIGDDDEGGRYMRGRFTEEVLRPFLAAANWSNIVIEVR